LQAVDGRSKQPAGLGLWSYWPVLAFMPISLLDFFLFVLPMLVMGIASVLVIREFHVSLQLTANNYWFFLGNTLYLIILGKSILLAAVVTRQGLGWAEALALLLPMCLVYGFACLSAWYVCRATPLTSPGLPKPVT